MSRYTPTIDNMTSKGWEYSNTIIMHGMEKVYDNVPTASYLSYIQAYIDLYVNPAGAISQTINSLDKIHPGITCLFLYEKTGLLKYKTAATFLRNKLVGPSATYSKTSNGILWHKLSGYNNIMMLDGMYMAHPFLAKYGSLFNDNAAIDTAVNQTLFAYNQLYDNTTHLIKHAWTSTPVSYGWANGTTGNSSEVWSRAMGWYMMALVDILKYVPAAHPKRANLLTALSNLAVGIKNYQDATSGLWYQVVDRGTSLTNNYLETSGSAMFVYALKTAINNGWISSATYLATVQSGWTGLQNKIGTYSDGKPMINDFAPAMTVQSSAANYVLTSFQPVDCPVATGTQHPHGYAAILMAASAMEFTMSTLPVKFVSFTAKENTGNIKLSWQSADENGTHHYEIQKSNNGNEFTTIGNVNATGISYYNWIDNSVNTSRVYYRIKAVDDDKSFYYSPILSIKQKNTGQSVYVSPNPVKDGQLNIVLNNIDAGNYSVKIISAGGTIVETTSFSIGDETNVVKALFLPAKVSHGVYYMQLKGKNSIINKMIMVN